MKRTTVLYEYEELLLGNLTCFSVAFSEKSEKALKENFCYIWKYAIENILKWDKDKAVSQMNMGIVRKLKLEPTLSVIGINYKKNLDFSKILDLVYGDRESIYVNKKQDMHTFDKAIGIYGPEIKSTMRSLKFFFESEENGYNRAMWSMQKITDIFLFDKSTEELYRFFESEESIPWMKKMRLDIPCRIYFNEDRLKYFYISQREENQNTELYNSIRKERS